jgi:hypothetical protein
MMKIARLISAISVVVVVVLFGSIFYSRTSRDVSTPATAPSLAPEAIRSQSHASRINETQSQGPSRWDGQGHQEEQAGTVSLPSPERPPARTDRTARERGLVEQQHALEEQREQETAADEDSVRATERPPSFEDRTEAEQRQAEEQRLIEEQQEPETDDRTEAEQRQAEEQRLIEEQQEPEAAADDESVRPPTADPLHH